MAVGSRQRSAPTDSTSQVRKGALPPLPLKHTEFSNCGHKWMLHLRGPAPFLTHEVFTNKVYMH